MQTVAQVVDSKSPYTAGHSERGALYTDIIATKMEIEDSRRRWLKRGALLHDLGKLGVSNSILDKEGALTPEEWQEVRLHPGYTEQILSRISPFQDMAVISGAHHERLDGKGYPNGLIASELTLETRIITICDIFDAITATRPYRGPIPVPGALEIMGRRWDRPSTVTATTRFGSACTNWHSTSADGLRTSILTRTDIFQCRRGADDLKWASVPNLILNGA